MHAPQLRSSSFVVRWQAASTKDSGRTPDVDCAGTDPFASFPRVIRLFIGQATPKVPTMIARTVRYCALKIFIQNPLNWSFPLLNPHWGAGARLDAFTVICQYVQVSFEAFSLSRRCFGLFDLSISLRMSVLCCTVKLQSTPHFIAGVSSLD